MYTTTLPSYATRPLWFSRAAKARLQYENSFTNGHCDVLSKCIKCVLVGDAAIGKTSLIISYTTDGYPQEYVPTAFDNYSVLVQVDGEPVKVQLCDTAGQADFDLLRPFCYPKSDVFLVCFSVINPSSFTNIQNRWMKELCDYGVNNSPRILIGTESDLRVDMRTLLDLSRHNCIPVSPMEAERLAKEIGAICYIECSSLTQQNLKAAFDAAILAALKIPITTNDRHSIVHEYCLGKSLTRILKKKLTIARSNSADCLRSIRVKRSASESRTDVPDRSYVPNGKKGPNYLTAESGQRSHPICKKEEERRCRKGTMSQDQNYGLGYWTGCRVSRIEGVPKMKKGWKKLFCAV